MASEELSRHLDAREALQEEVSQYCTQIEQLQLDLTAAQSQIEALQEQTERLSSGPSPSDAPALTSAPGGTEDSTSGAGDSDETGFSTPRSSLPDLSPPATPSEIGAALAEVAHQLTSPVGPSRSDSPQPPELDAALAEAARLRAALAVAVAEKAAAETALDELASAASASAAAARESVGDSPAPSPFASPDKGAGGSARASELRRALRDMQQAWRESEAHLKVDLARATAMQNELQVGAVLFGLLLRPSRSSRGSLPSAGCDCRLLFFMFGRSECFVNQLWLVLFLGGIG